MSARSRDLLVLFALGLVVNGLVGALVANPGYMDAAYYYAGGTIIARGAGLAEPYLWNYVNAPPTLPAPAFAYWQPLPSLLAALGLAAFRWMAPFDAAQIPFVLLVALLPLIAYAVGLHLGERRHGILAGLLTIFSGYYVIYWSLPDSFTPFAVAGAGALALAGWGRSGGRWIAWPLAGICAGLAHLARADGLLLIGVVALAALLPPHPTALREAMGEVREKPLRRRILYAWLGIAGYILVIAPWFARNLAVFGSVQAPGGLSTLWLVDYNDLFSYPPELTPTRYFAAGWSAILRTKWDALLGNLATFVGVNNLVFLTPLTLIGAGRRWRHDWLLAGVVYGVALFAAMTFAFSLPGLRGGWFHSGGALMPFIAGAAVLGLDDVIRWVARRRASWRPAQARRVLGGASVFFAAIITLYLATRAVVGFPYRGALAWNRADAVYGEIGAVLDEMKVPPDAPVMVNNPPGFYVHTGHGGIPLPNGDESTLLRAADDYAVQYLVVDHNVAPPLVPLYRDGPTSERLDLIQTLGSEFDPVYLYRILPVDGGS